MKRYVLLAGVNGAGKSTLFSLISSLSEIEKINLDETFREISGKNTPRYYKSSTKGNDGNRFMWNAHFSSS